LIDKENGLFLNLRRIIQQLNKYPENKNMRKKSTLILAIVLNCIVLLGQLWPKGAPPFAGIVNIFTMILNLPIFINIIRNYNKYLQYDTITSTCHDIPHPI
jgi:hypothetical protein